MTKVELLAPAGSYDSLIAAVAAGADAVYLGLNIPGMGILNARQGAANFNKEMFSKACDHCHTRGVKVYVTLNTLLGERDFYQALDFLSVAVSGGADAVILQDPGFASFVLDNKKSLSGLEVHASTQMTIYNKEGLKLAKDMGFDRCITARELSLDRLKELCDSNILPVECFCHGALCMGLSGQCLMSSLRDPERKGERSGNKGSCAQSCRLMYSLYSDLQKFKDFKYILSPRDLCSLSYLDRLIDTGIASLKIEGRLKSPEYVSVVTSKYRKAIDLIEKGLFYEYKEKNIDRDVEEMASLFSRGQFTSGHQLGKMPIEHITFDSPGRTGLLIGKATKKPERFMSVNTDSKTLNVYTVNTEITQKGWEVKVGDGVTFASGGDNFGGTVNGVKVSGNCHILKIAGRLPDKSVIGKMFSSPKGVSVYLTYNSTLAKEVKSGKEYRSVPVTGVYKAEVGEPASLVLRTEIFPECEVKVYSDRPVERGKQYTLGRESVCGQLSKMGGTPYELKDIDVFISEGAFMSAGELNSLRRKAVDLLTEKRICNGRKKMNPVKEKIFHDSPAEVPVGKYSLYLSGEDSFERIPSYVKELRDDIIRVYVPAGTDANVIRRIGLEYKNAEMIGFLPYINIGKAREKAINALREDSLFKGVMLSNIGDINMVRDIIPKDHIICGDYGLQIQNLYSADMYRGLGVKVLTCSPELLEDEAVELADNMRNIGVVPEIIVGGPVALMKSFHCVVSECKACRRGQRFFLEDKDGRKYPVLCNKDDHNCVIFSEDRSKLNMIKGPFVGRINVL